MTASPIASVRVFETVRYADVVALRSVRSNAGSRDHRAERSSVLGICFWPFIVRQHAPIVHPCAMLRPRRSALPRERFRPLALFGHGAMSELSPLSRVERKLDFGTARAAFDPDLTLALAPGQRVVL